MQLHGGFDLVVVAVLAEIMPPGYDDQGLAMPARSQDRPCSGMADDELRPSIRLLEFGPGHERYRIDGTAISLVRRLGERAGNHSRNRSGKHLE
jgi:hypothetical protein